MTFLVDASVAIKWFVPETLHIEALSLLDGAEQLQAPDLLVVEVANIAWKKAIKGEISDEEARRIVTAIPRFFHVIHPSSDYAERALEIARSLRHPVYDCFYLACAEEAGTPLITADERLCRAVEGNSLGAIVRSLHTIDPDEP